MRKENSIYVEKLEKTYKEYEKKLLTAKNLEDLLETGVGLQEDIETLNIDFGCWAESKGYDHDAIYYTANFIVENSPLPEICLPDCQNIEMRKKLLADLLFQKIDQKKKIKIHAIEPHPDDILGSASGLCYTNEAIVTLHTMCRVLDDRDKVYLSKDTYEEKKSIRRKPNIISHKKYGLDDFHWDQRNRMNPDYEEIISGYRTKYGEEGMEKLEASIKDIIHQTELDDAYLAFPLGIEHPMHMLVTYMCIEQLKKHKLDPDRIIVYIDHPYDYLNVGTGRLQKAREYIQTQLETKLCRCDDISIDQSVLKDILIEVYGEKHYGEFSGSLENTYCSYFISDAALNHVKSFLQIHVNNILYITDQAKPFKKTGGSGEVAYVLSKTLLDYVNDVRIMMPKYKEDHTSFPENEKLDIIPFVYNGNTEDIGDVPCRIEERRYDGLIYYLVEMEGYFGDTDPMTGDHGKKYAIFCDAVMQKALNSIDYIPSVLHCNDWQTALIPMLKKTKYHYYQPDLKVIYTIHFYGYRGIFKKDNILKYVGLDTEKCRLCVSCSKECPLNKIDLLSDEDIDKLNVTPSQMSFMKAGIEFADAVSTVSKGYARELQNYPDFRNVNVIGIRNGINQQKYVFTEQSGFVDTDKGDFQTLKRKNKDILQKKLGLKKDFSIPLICMVSRLSTVKGIEVVKNIIQEILAMDVQFIIIGNDDDKTDQPYASCFRRIEKEYPGKFIYREFQEELEYQTYAGSDILLMPSLSEACGTTQMMAMQYGVIPIVSMIPAFNDTVLDFKNRHKKDKNPQYWDRGIGFFAYKDDCWVLLEVIKKAIEIYRDDNVWVKMAEDCQKVDFGWKNQSIRAYMKLYNEVSTS